MQTIWRAAIKANIFLLPHIHYMGLWKQIHLHNKGLQTFISTQHTHLRFKKVLYFLNPLEALRSFIVEKKLKRGILLLPSKEYYKKKGEILFFILFLVERENGSFIQSDNHFQITRIKVSHFQSFLFVQLLYFQFQIFEKFFFLLLLLLSCVYKHITSILGKLFHFRCNFSLRM